MTLPLPSRAAVALFALLATLPAAAQRPRFRILPAPKTAGGEVKVTVGEGGRVEGQQDEYSILEGKVTIEYQDIKLQANKVTYNQKTRDVSAEGNVIIDQGPTRVTAARAVYNLDSKTGTFFEATGTLDPQMYFAGDQVEKLDEDTYRLTKGVITSCDLESPAWSFHVGSAEFTLDDYARLRDLSFRAGGIPIFYTPRLIWPTKSERSRGFLIPRIRFSGDLGERLELGYFIPFGDSADATLTTDLNTKGYYGAGINLRYLPSQNVKLGDLYAYAVRDPEPADPFGIPLQTIDSRLQWRYRYQHSQENLPGGFRGVVDIEDFSDLNFFRRYSDDSRFLTLSNVYSSAYLTKNRPRYSLNVLADRRELLFAGTAPQRFEQLPSIQYRMYPQRMGRTPLYFSLESSASRLRTNSVRFIEDTSGAYYRTDLFPTLSMQLRTPPWFSIRPQLSFRETYYSASLEENLPPGSPRLMSEEGINRSYAQGQVEVVGPSFSRIFNRQYGGFSRFKHVIEPRFRYVYTSDVEDQERIIRFDTVDSPFLPIVRDSVEYSLTQRLIGKESAAGGSAREVLSFALRQSASLSDPFPRASGLSRAVLEHRFTPLLATLRVNPYQSVTVDANVSVGNASRKVEQASVSANLIGGENRYLNLTWFATYPNPHQLAAEASQWRILTGSPLLRGRLRADLQLNYDAEEGKFLEQRYILGMTGSCYGIAVGARRYLIYDPFESAKWSADVSFTLKNVGTIGSIR